MATNNNNVMVGTAIASVGNYTAAGGSSSMLDLGHLKTPPGFSAAIEEFLVKSERAYGAIRRVITDASFTIKCALLETTQEALRISLGQPSANKTGAGSNLTLLVGVPVEQYHQVQMDVPGPGTSGRRLLTFWRCAAKLSGDILYAKGDSTEYPLELTALFDDSVTTADKLFRSVDQ